MKLEVLLSCMNQENDSLIAKSNLSDTLCLMVNQVDDGDNRVQVVNDLHRIIFSNEKGLSKSRNMAISNAKSDICLLCDDDENFVDNLSQIIVSAYEKYTDADVIVFKISNRPKSIKDTPHRMKRYELLKVSSWQISFRRESIKDKIYFDEKIGAGSEYGGAGEETLFLLNCLKRGLIVYYVPNEIGTVAQEESTWFKGFDEDYFYKRGTNTRYIYGFWTSALYGLYFVLSHRKMYKDTISPYNAWKYILKGIRDNRIGKEAFNVEE